VRKCVDSSETMEFLLRVGTRSARNIGGYVRLVNPMNPMEFWFEPHAWAAYWDDGWEFADPSINGLGDSFVTSA
jgi:hypothetical protein